MGSRSGDDQKVEDLVVAEDPRVGVGALGGVDHRAGGVEDAAGSGSEGAGDAHLVPEAREGDRRRPSQATCRSAPLPTWGVSIQTISTMAPAISTNPDDDQDRVGERTVEDEQGKGRVGAGDEEEDHRVIEAAHPAANAGPGPVDPVVESAGAEQGRETDRVDRHGEGRLRSLGGDDQDRRRGRARQRRPTRGRRRATSA